MRNFLKLFSKKFGWRGKGFVSLQSFAAKRSGLGGSGKERSGMREACRARFRKLFFHKSLAGKILPFTFALALRKRGSERGPGKRKKPKKKAGTIGSSQGLGGHPETGGLAGHKVL